MPYTEDDVEHLEDTRFEWLERLDNLVIEFGSRDYTTERGREYAIHGLGRRLVNLRHCLDRTFKAIPPEANNPTRANLLDATAFIQAFMTNVYGSIDNLAHIWCEEANIRSASGQILPPLRIGLRKTNVQIRQSLSSKTQDYLAEHDDWFEYLESYRHALAHRIPLYIPPRQLNHEARIEYEQLENKKANALSTRNWKVCEDIDEKMIQVGLFEPLIMHSFIENATPVRFHAQMICDLATIVEIGQRINLELQSLNSRRLSTMPRPPLPPAPH